jgi:NAD-dependent DNA ligase
MSLKNNTTSFLEGFKTRGISVLETLNERQMENVLKHANEAYYNGESIMTDNEYDIIKEYFEVRFPKNLLLQTIGAPIQKNKVQLPYFMPSMDKIKPDTSALDSWMAKYHEPYLVSCKLDGVSGLYVCRDGERNLYTRGDGTIGQDVSHLLSVLDLPSENNIVVRGEFIMSKNIFETKYKQRFANARNLVSGIINSKTIDDKTSDLEFVAYELIEPVVRPSDQLRILSNIGELHTKGFTVVHNAMFSEMNNDILSQLLVDWRKNYKYEIDGIIVSSNMVYPRNNKNPDHSFAFKMVLSDQVAEAKVLEVLWTPSKNGYLKPRVRIEPVNIGGVRIEFATGFNAKFIETNKIGVGAIVEIIRSGDVIPHIKSITVQAENANMPILPYYWTDTHIDIILDNVDDNTTVQEKNITAFFVGIQVDGLSTGNIKRLMKAGFNTVQKIIYMTKEEMLSVEGFQLKTANKLYDGIRDKLESASLLDIMVASNKLGRGIGRGKLAPLMKKYPTFLTNNYSKNEMKELLQTIDGIGSENATSIVDNVDNFMIFLKDIGLLYKLHDNQINTNLQVTDTTHILSGKNIVMTKVRDASIISALEKYGGKLEDNVKKNTFVLITKSHDDISSKTKKAQELGIPILTPSEFIEKYL